MTCNKTVLMMTCYKTVLMMTVLMMNVIKLC